MSHITEIELVIDDAAMLAKACEALGFEFVWNQKSYKWFGRFVGDTPQPPGVEVADMGKCHHAIRVPGAEYEVGVVLEEDGTYRLRYDYWSHGGLKQAIGETAAPIVQRYGVEAVKRQAIMENMTVIERPLEDGSIQVVVEV